MTQALGHSCCTNSEAALDIVYVKVVFLLPRPCWGAEDVNEKKQTMRAASTAKRNFIATFYMWVLSSPGHWSESLAIGKYVTSTVGNIYFIFYLKRNHHKVFKNAIYQIWIKGVGKPGEDLANSGHWRGEVIAPWRTVADCSCSLAWPPTTTATNYHHHCHHQLPPPLLLPPCHPPQSQTYRLRVLVGYNYHPKPLTSLSLTHSWPMPDKQHLEASKQYQGASELPDGGRTPCYFLLVLSWNSDSSWALHNRPNWQCLWAIN